MMRTIRHTGSVFLLAILAACGSSSAPQTNGGHAGNGDGYSAQITPTAPGVPHIKADDFGVIGDGYGHAFAEDNPGVLLDDLVPLPRDAAQDMGTHCREPIMPKRNQPTNAPTAYTTMYRATHNTSPTP